MISKRIYITDLFRKSIVHFNTTLEAALCHTNVEPQVYPNLIQAVHEDIGYLHKYMR